MGETTLSNAFSSFLDQHEQYLRDCAARRAASLQSLPAQLAVVGVAVVTAGYSGCGDSGQFDEFTFLTESGADVSDQVPAEVRAEVETLLYDTLELRHGGWENNDGAEGEFQWTLAGNQFEHTHRSFYTECDTTEHDGFDDLLPAGGPGEVS